MFKSSPCAEFGNAVAEFPSLTCTATHLGGCLGAPELHRLPSDMVSETSLWAAGVCCYPTSSLCQVVCFSWVELASKYRSKGPHLACLHWVKRLKKLRDPECSLGLTREIVQLCFWGDEGTRWWLVLEWEAEVQEALWRYHHPQHVVASLGGPVQRWRMLRITSGCGPAVGLHSRCSLGRKRTEILPGMPRGGVP